MEGDDYCDPEVNYLRKSFCNVDELEEEEEGKEGNEYIFFNVPLYGHVNPTLDLISELSKRGNKIHYYCSGENFRKQITSCGGKVNFVDYNDIDDKIKFTFETSRSETNLYWVAKEMMFHSELILDSLLGGNGAKKFKNVKCILYDVSAIWGKFIGEILKIPSVCCFPGLAPQWRFALTSKSVVGRFVKERMKGMSYIKQAKIVRARLIKKWGISKFSISKAFAGSRHLNIVFTSREFQPHGDSMSKEGFVFTGPSLSFRSSKTDDNFPWEEIEVPTTTPLLPLKKEGLDEDRPNFRPIIYVSMGTLYRQDPKFFHVCFDAFRDLDVSVVISVGRSTDIEKTFGTGEIPSNFLIRNFVPQLEILQKASVFVSHGGMNGISESLFYQVPMVLIPKTIEQQLNSCRMDDLGTGMVILIDHTLEEEEPTGKSSPSHSPRGARRTLTPERLREVTLKVMTTDSYRKRAKTIADSFSNAPGPSIAAKKISTVEYHKGGMERILNLFSHSKENHLGFLFERE